MLIAISGAQGSGKTTTLNLIKQKGYPVIERKTARSILDEWKVTLQEVNKDSSLTMKFQEEITRRKIQDEAQAEISLKTYFTERSHADLFTYACVSLGKDNHHSNWLNNYYETCKAANRAYSHIYYLNAGKYFIPEQDGVRGINKHYAKMIDVSIKQFTKQMLSSNTYFDNIGDGLTREPVNIVVDDIFRSIQYSQLKITMTDR